MLPSLGTLTIAQEEVMVLSSMAPALSWQVANWSKQKVKINLHEEGLESTKTTFYRNQGLARSQV